MSSIGHLKSLIYKEFYMVKSYSKIKHDAKTCIAIKYLNI